MPTLYHATTEENYNSIKVVGLKPSTRWKSNFPIKPQDHPILKKNQNLIFLVDNEGTTGPETFAQKVLFGNGVPLKVTLPENWPLTNIGYGMGIWVTSRGIPPKYISRMSKDIVAQNF